MVMVGQQRRLAQPLRWGRRERWAVAAAAGLLLAAVVVVVVVATGSRRVAQRGCIDVTTPSTTGAALVHACGGDGRTLCRQGDRARLPVSALRSQCARAGYRYGAAAA